MVAMRAMQTDERRAGLAALAQRLGAPVEQLIAAAGADIPTETTGEFRAISAAIMTENAEAYRRLA